MADNRTIYNTHYTAGQLDLPTDPYDRHVADARLAMVREFAPGRDVLDLCCGTGSYLIPFLDDVNSAVGVDFSEKMLQGFRDRLRDGSPAKLKLIEADATALPLAGALFDFVFSFTALYYLENVEDAVCEAARVLRPGGHAVLEFGNSNSLTTPVTRGFHEAKGWARSFPVPPARITGMVRRAGFTILRVRRFQILPLLGAPPGMAWLKPMASPRLKPLLGARIGARSLDELLSALWPLSRFAFRHILVVKKT